MAWESRHTNENPTPSTSHGEPKSTMPHFDNIKRFIGKVLKRKSQSVPTTPTSYPKRESLEQPDLRKSLVFPPLLDDGNDRKAVPTQDIPALSLLEPKTLENEPPYTSSPDPEASNEASREDHESRPLTKSTPLRLNQSLSPTPPHGRHYGIPNPVDREKNDQRRARSRSL